MHTNISPALRRSRWLAGAAAGAIAAVMATSAYADGVEVVTVTASKRETSLQQTPLAITALSGDALNAAQVNTSSDLQLQVPSFVMSTNVIQGEAYIRGIGTDISSIAADPSVAFMIDGIYLPRLSTSLQDIYDVQRVEVVKGPLGTLYGRNATGGVVNIVTNQPDSTPSLDADVLYGNYDDFRVRIAANGAINDAMDARVSLIRHSRDGYVKNVFLGGTVDPQDTWAGRGSLLVHISDDVSLQLSADFSDDKGAPASAVRVLSTDAPALFFGGTVTNDPYKVNENLRNTVNNNQYGYSGKLSWNAGFADFTSLTSFRHSSFKLILDLDGTESNWFTHEPDTQGSDTFSQEFQLASKTGGALDWILGAYYFNEDANSNYNLFLPLFAVNLNPVSTNTTNAYAVYGEATYHLTDQLSFTAGLRYSDEHKKTAVTMQTFGTPFASFAGKKSWSAVTPKFGVQYNVDDDVMLYASATKGFKSGGFNSTAIQTPQSFNPEFVWSYEGGVKTTLWDGRAIFNVSAFYYDYSDLQVNKYDAVNIVTIENAAQATIKGLEIETQIKPTDALTLGANVSLLDPEYGEFITIDPDHPLLGYQNLKGNQLVRAPKFTANVSAAYTFDLESLGSLTARTNYYYRSRAYFTPYNDNAVSQEGFGLWNASLQFDSSDGRWFTSVYMNNITDQVYYQEKARSASIVGTIGWPGTPRTFGATVGVHL